MKIPEEFKKLFHWIEVNGFYEDSAGGRIGYLFPINKIRNEWQEHERTGGTYIEFYAEKEYENMWFFKDGIGDRLRIFARTGADGSMAAFWIDDNGKQQIVHLGSGSGSTLACVLCKTPLDFLRLIAIGYDEICWQEEFDLTPAETFRDENFFIRPNIKYQDWLIHEFGTSIPDKANEIVSNAAEYGETESGDPFCCWLDSIEM